MKPSIITAIRGPIMLMAIGALFAADQMDRMSITRSWPALLILFGVLKLLEFVSGRQRIGETQS
jgi:hypothetical protein